MDIASRKMPDMNQNQYLQISAYYYQNFTKGYEMDYHLHEAYEIMYCYGGQCVIGLPDTNKVLKKGQFIVIRRNTPHFLFIEKGCLCTIGNLEFMKNQIAYGTNLGKLIQEENGVEKLLSSSESYTVINDINNFGQALKLLIYETQSKGLLANSAYSVLLLLNFVLIKLTESLSMNGQDNEETIYIRNAKDFILSNITEELNVKTISKAVCISATHLERCFSKYAGCGIMAFVAKSRMERAKFYLLNSDRDITNIAFEVGYNSRQNFCHAFEAQFHMSPSQFRKDARIKLADSSNGGLVLSDSCSVVE